MRTSAGLLFFLLLSTATVFADFPDDLDGFLEKLFDTEECEDFISSSEFTNIATRKCDPFQCDFPRQICARPAAKFQDSSANTCRAVPRECLKAANGGVDVGPSSIPSTMAPIFPGHMLGTPPPNLITRPTDPRSICEMDAPTGRFCGFRPMYTYNKETLQCDEFWFPGCRTSETNANLFENFQSCQKIADLCKPTPAPTAPPPRQFTLPPKQAPPPPPPPPPSPKGGSPFVEALGGLAGGKSGNSALGQGALGAIGMFTGSGLGPTGQGPFGNFVPQGGGGGGPAPPQPSGGGDEQDLGLFGLIQQGIMGAQAVKQGGGGGKEAAAQAAGKILQQFTGFDLGGGGGGFGNLFG